MPLEGELAIVVWQLDIQLEWRFIGVTVELIFSKERDEGWIGFEISANPKVVREGSECGVG